MSVDGVRNAFETSFAQTQAAHAAESARGVFMGHTVSVKESPASLLANAAEELGFSVDRTKDYELARRKEREATGISPELIERYQAVLRETQGEEGTERLARTLKNAADREAMARALHEAHSDPADAYAALLAAEEAMRSDPEVSLEKRDAVRRLAEEFLNENARGIKLGLRGAVTGSDYPELGDAAETRDLYRRTVGEFSSVNEVFDDIRTHYGKDFDRAMDFLFAAIGADIAAEASGTPERAFLESTHEKLGQVRLVKSAYAGCAELLERWANVHRVAAALTPMELLGDVLALRGKPYLSAQNANEICRKAAPPDIEREVLFLQELLQAVRKFPVRLFDDEAGRMIVMDAVQAAVDAAIEREDQYLASLED